MFGQKPSNSIILVTRREVIRSDFTRQATGPVSTNRLEVDAESGLAQAIAPIVTRYRRLPAKTLVLSTDIWSQIIKLPIHSVVGLDQDDLIEALKFEAETLSGIEIDDLSLAFVRLGIHEDQQRFWVSALRNSELRSAKQTLENAGARNILFAHPAGFSMAGKRESDSRIEYWSDLVFQFGNDQAGPVRIMQLGTSASLEIERQVNEATSNAQEILVGLDSVVPSVDLPSTMDLTQTEKLEQWLTNVAQLSNRELVVPSIQLKKRSAGTAPLQLWAIVSAILVAGCCFWHWNYIASRTLILKSDIQRIEQPGKEKSKIDTQMASILATRTQAESEAVETNDELLQIQFFVNSQQNRFFRILKHLMETRTNDLVIDEISETAEGVMISGVSLNGQSAQAFAKKLRTVAIELGWAVNPAKQKGQQKMTSGGPWDFDILLTDIGPFETDPNRLKLGLGGL